MHAINPKTDFIELRPNDLVKIKVAYADPGYAHNYFGQIYHPHARMWAQKRLADIIYDGAEIAYREMGWKFLLLDAFRATEAQAKMYAICERDFAHAARSMNKTVSDLVAPSGRGAHPRGWAVDLAPVTDDGGLIDMGGHFDQFWKPFSLRATQFESPFSSDAEILQRRAILENIMQRAGSKHNLPVSCKTSDEWWDFRPVPDHYNQFPALSNNDMPESMRLLPGDAVPPRDYPDPVILDPVLKTADGKIQYAPLATRRDFHRAPAHILRG